MTISILAFDKKSGTYGGAATTGSLCVGGWVLRGDAESGLSASQGSLPSTLWGQDVLVLMGHGATAEDAVNRIVKADAGRDERQLSALDPNGGTGAFTGANSIPTAGIRTAQGVVVAGNLLTSGRVLDACLDGYLTSQGSVDARLQNALRGAADAGGDSRGLLSAALLIARRDTPPLDLRVDYSERPLDALADLHRRATSGDYARWVAHVPTRSDPERGTPFAM